METYYDILQVKRDATAMQIKKSFLSLVSKYHPDIYKGSKEFAQKLTSSLTQAYTTLKDDALRQAYDEKVFGTKNKRFNKNLSNQKQIISSGDNSSQSEVKTLLRNTKMKRSKRLKKNFFKTKLFYFLLIFFSIEVVLLLFLVRE